MYDADPRNPLLDLKCQSVIKLQDMSFVSLHSNFPRHTDKLTPNIHNDHGFSQALASLALWELADRNPKTARTLRHHLTLKDTMIAVSFIQH